MGRVLIVLLVISGMSASAVHAEEPHPNLGSPYRAETTPVPSVERPLSLVWSLGASVLSGPRYEIERSNTTLTGGVGRGPAVSFSILSLAPWDLGLDFALYFVGTDDVRLSESRLLLSGAHFGYAHRVAPRATLTASARVMVSRLSFGDADAITFGGGVGASGRLFYRVFAAVGFCAELGVLWLPFGGNGTTGIAVAPAAFGTVGLAFSTSGAPD